MKKEDFYDIIIKCNSIYGLKEGWDVLMNERGKQNYLNNKNNEYTKIGIIGSENRGKSTILSDFSKIELPTGVSIKTEGLSIKYPDLEKFKNRKIILLDSAGKYLMDVNLRVRSSAYNTLYNTLKLKGKVKDSPKEYRIVEGNVECLNNKKLHLHTKNIFFYLVFS